MVDQMTRFHRAVLASASIAVFALLILADTAHATPQFARTFNKRCIDCHTVPPMLNAEGLDFWQRGYRPGEDEDQEKFMTYPFAMWATVRQEDQPDRNFGEGYVNRVELISGGAIPIPGIIQETLSYFVEWRMISLESRSNGTLRDRSGRFEDAYINWQPMGDTGRIQLTFGQFRSLQQVDVSRRLNLSEPAVFSSSLAGDPVAGNARVTSLRSFSPSGRQPGIMFQYQAIQGESHADGLFFSAVLPWVGEWSLPITPEAHREASFVSQGPPKGAFLEGYYRQDLSSIGAHGFIDNDRWLFTMVGVFNYQECALTQDLFLTLAYGWDDTAVSVERQRRSLEILYLPHLVAGDWVRGGVGFRAEHITGPGTFPAYIPYVVLSGPNAYSTFLAQLECRIQENNNVFFLDMSLIF